ncbi:MAG: GNAT family N-acetyltransferase [Bdellovibrionales bacterium]|jgi:ribosomal protein S18 acetylase RimI-like enzyme|nr:GNAT family N-acetyltransferase [Bdellovibrionales bacterium]
MIRIAPLEESQFPATAKLLSSAFNIPAARNRQELENTYGGLTKIFAAARDGALLGVIRCHKFDNHLSISLLAVDDGARKQGIGSHLVRHAEDFMQREWMENKETYISLEDATQRDNPASQFYERLGYTPWAGMTGNDGLPMMYKWLKP